VTAVKEWDYTTGEWKVTNPPALNWDSLQTGSIPVHGMDGAAYMLMADELRRLKAAKPPASVWVALAVWTKAVVVADRRNTAGQQIQGGRMAVFQQVPTHTEDVVTAEVVAVCLTHAEASEATVAHRAVHADGCDYKITEHPIGVAPPAPPPEVVAFCVACGERVSDGTSWHQKCRQEMFNRNKEADPGDEMPTIRNTYTPPQDRSGRGSGM